MGKGKECGKRPLVYAWLMNLPRLAELLPDLLQPQVRDLAWALLSPPMLSSAPAPQRHPLAASRWSRAPDELAHWLYQLDTRPEGLQAWLDQRRSQRLGLYYERLWQFALYQAEDIELLRANLPIVQEGRTLGELDLLIRDDEGIHHLELAVKFYLGLEHGDRTRHSQWIGPNSSDRLDIKLQRTCGHQLKLSSTPCAREILGEITSGAISSAFWLAGYLFQPWSLPPTPPEGANPGHLSGLWLRHSDWPGYRRATLQAHPDSRWLPLPRSAWLAPARVEDKALWPQDEFENWIENSPALPRPWLLTCLSPGNDQHWMERERLFLVPDSWPE